MYNFNGSRYTSNYLIFFPGCDILQTCLGGNVTIIEKANHVFVQGRRVRETPITQTMIIWDKSRIFHKTFKSGELPVSNAGSSSSTISSANTHTEIFQADAYQHFRISIKKTKKMRGAEMTIGEGLEFFIPRSYVSERKTDSEIADELKTVPATILIWRKKMGIESRSHDDPKWQQRNSQAQKKIFREHPERALQLARFQQEKARKTKDRLLGNDPKEKLNKMYFQQNMKLEDMAKEFNVTLETVRRWMIDFGIARRKREEYITRVVPRINENTRETIAQASNSGVLDTLPAREAQILRMRYEQLLTLDQIGQQIGVSKERVRQLIQNGFIKLRRKNVNV